MNAKSIYLASMILAAISVAWSHDTLASDNDAAKTDVAPLPKGTLSGTVVDPDGKAVSDAGFG